MSGTRTRWPALAILLALSLATSGCYYSQAVRGHFEVMGKREPIGDVIESSDTPAELARRLRLVEEARRFSVAELGLPDNKSYTTYADLERNYVVWNVVAAPEFSLEPKTWCYPVAGCVSYRGYFDEKAARRKAGELDEQGYDVAFGGVAAYSTLGRFADPILNTMTHWEDADLVAVMFHELAHQVVYVKDDTGFNESFATAVEEFGLERWLQSRGESAALEDYRARRELRRQTMALIDVARTDLESLYAEDATPENKRSLKAARLEAMATEIRDLHAGAGRKPPAWLVSQLNNARLVSMALYHGRLPQFRRLLEDCDNDLGCFYTEAEALADLDGEARDARLDAL